MFQAMVTRLHSARAREAAQQKLTESQRRLDDSEHRLRHLLAQRVKRPACRRRQPMRHRLDRRWILRRFRRRCEALGQRRMMRLTAHGDQRFDPRLVASRDVRRAEIAGIRQQGFVTPGPGCRIPEGAIAGCYEENQLCGLPVPAEIIRQAIWLYLRFTLSLRDVEDLLAERGVAVSYETVRRWVNHFGPMIAANLRKRRPKPHTTWHLDEVYLKIAGRMVYLWRAVDAEGEVLDVPVQSKRNKLAALKLMRKLLKKYSIVPERMVTDDLRSYPAPRSEILASNATMSAGDGRTTEPRIRISRHGDRSARCSGSRAPLRAEIPVESCCRLQRLQRPTPSHFSPNAPDATRRGDEHLVRGRRCGVRIPAQIDQLRSCHRNVTTPSPPVP